MKSSLVTLPVHKPNKQVKCFCYSLLGQSTLSLIALVQVIYVQAVRVFFLWLTESGPPSKKSLNFYDLKPENNGEVTDRIATNSGHCIKRKSQSKKRDCDELFFPLSGDEEEDAVEFDSVPG